MWLTRSQWRIPLQHLWRKQCFLYNMLHHQYSIQRLIALVKLTSINDRMKTLILHIQDGQHCSYQIIGATSLKATENRYEWTSVQWGGPNDNHKCRLVHTRAGLNRSQTLSHDMVNNMEDKVKGLGRSTLSYHLYQLVKEELLSLKIYRNGIIASQWNTHSKHCTQQDVIKRWHGSTGCLPVMPILISSHPSAM